MEVVAQGPPAEEVAEDNVDLGTMLQGLAQPLDGKKPDLTTTLKFDFYEDGIYRLVINKGACRLEPSDGEAVATMKLRSSDAQKLFAGQLDPMVSVMTGKIKINGDASALMILQDLGK